METTCKFPGCKRHPEKNGFCVGHRIYADAKISSEKPKQIAPRSEKLKEFQKEYVKIVKELLKENNVCELRTPDCTGIAQGLHHMKGRGANLLNRKYLKRSCNRCNLYVELHPQYALDHGLSISKHKKEL